jgi:hypothetical protein
MIIGPSSRRVAIWPPSPCAATSQVISRPRPNAEQAGPLLNRSAWSGPVSGGRTVFLFSSPSEAGCEREAEDHADLGCLPPGSMRIDPAALWMSVQSRVPGPALMRERSNRGLPARRRAGRTGDDRGGQIEQMRNPRAARIGARQQVGTPGTRSSDSIRARSH